MIKVPQLKASPKKCYIYTWYLSFSACTEREFWLCNTLWYCFMFRFITRELLFFVPDVSKNRHRVFHDKDHGKHWSSDQLFKVQMCLKYGLGIEKTNDLYKMWLLWVVFSVKLEAIILPTHSVHSLFCFFPDNMTFAFFQSMFSFYRKNSTGR